MADLKIPYASRKINDKTHYYSAVKLGALTKTDVSNLKLWSKNGELHCEDCRNSSLPDRLKVVFPTVKTRPYFAHISSKNKCAVSKESIHHMKLKIALQEHHQAEIPDDDPEWKGPRPDAIVSFGEYKIAVEGQTDRSKSAYTFSKILEKNDYYLTKGWHPLWIYITTDENPHPNNLLKTCLALQGCIIIYHPANQTLSYRKYSDKTWRYEETIVPISEAKWCIHDKPPNQESYTLYKELQSLMSACGGILFDG